MPQNEYRDYNDRSRSVFGVIWVQLGAFTDQSKINAIKKEISFCFDRRFEADDYLFDDAQREFMEDMFEAFKIYNINLTSGQAEKLSYWVIDSMRFNFEGVDG